MKHTSIQKWWPLGQSFDLVAGDVEATATAVQAEVLRFTNGESLKATWVKLEGLHDLFGSVDTFTNVPTNIFALPTLSRWTVLWTNCFFCNGYEQLSHCLTINHGFETIHWSAHDQQTTFRPGSNFTHRSNMGGNLRGRSVYCAKEENGWLFGQTGEPLPEEDETTNNTLRKEDRLNESVLMGLLQRLGARPWQEDFYDFSRPCFQLLRTDYPSSIVERSSNDVVLGNHGNAA